MNKVLESILPKLGLTYQFINNTIVLSQDPKAATTQGSSVMAKAVPVRTVSGVVRDEAGKPIVGVSVISVKDRQRGTSTAADGTFSFRVPADETHITVSMIGMKTQTLPVGNGTLNVTMKSDVIESSARNHGLCAQGQEQLHGYGDAGEGCRSVKVNPTNMLQALQVYDPSFVISGHHRRIRIEPQLHSRPHRDPRRELVCPTSRKTRSKPTPRCRSSSSTVQVEVEKVYNLDINRVENVTILKDAAASSIYGSRAANAWSSSRPKCPRKAAYRSPTRSTPASRPPTSRRTT